MSAETTVTVVIENEVSAQVLPNASNTLTIATSTESLNLFQMIVEFFKNLF